MYTKKFIKIRHVEENLWPRKCLENKLKKELYAINPTNKMFRSLYINVSDMSKNGKYSILEKLVHRLLEVLVHIVHM